MAHAGNCNLMWVVDPYYFSRSIVDIYLRCVQENYNPYIIIRFAPLMQVNCPSVSYCSCAVLSCAMSAVMIRVLSQKLTCSCRLQHPPLMYSLKE